MIARQGAPVIGAITTAGERPRSPVEKWQINLGYRWQPSFRHFRGSHEEPHRVDQGTQVENRLHLFDVAVSYQVSSRWSVNASLPFMSVDRIAHGPDVKTESTGIGDMSVGAKFWLFKPPTESGGNIQVGLSLKLPTGDSNVLNRVGDNTVVVDQSIQQGDSGTGFALDYTAFKALKRFTLFSSGVYLFNPKGAYTPTGWNQVNRPSLYPGYSQPGVVYSVGDQYLIQGGVGYAVPKLHGLGLTGTARMEGIPSSDVFGSDIGFRRPGYGVSLAPGAIYMRGNDTFSVSVPIAVYRNRTRSFQDKERGTHGDAAFADYVLLIGYSRTF